MNEDFANEINSYFRHFCKELEITGKSNYTIISYNTTITSFIKFVQQYTKPINFETFKKIDFMNFLEYKNDMLQKQSELKASSKNLYLTHLKTFFSYIEENMDVSMRTSRIFNVIIKMPKREPKGIEHEHVIMFENYLNSVPCNSFTNIRNVLLLKILFYTGARRGELENIKVDKDSFVDRGPYYIIKTIGKGSKERYLYIKKAYIEDELLYFQERDYTFIAKTKNGRIMSGSEIYAMINIFYKNAGIGKLYSGAHILRHTFAKAEYAKNKDIVNVQKRLGHASVNTTMIYADPTQREVERVFAEEIKQD